MDTIISHDISQVIKSLSLVGNLYIGNMNSITPQYLNQYRITTVLSVQDDIEVKLDGVITKQIIIADSSNVNISQYFEETFQFIDLHLRKSNVLVHCVAGKSRSAAIVVAYLMKKKCWDEYWAEEHLKRYRPQIEINEGFLEQLVKYRKQLEKGYKNNDIDLILQNDESNQHGNLLLGGITSLDCITKCHIGAVVSIITDFKPNVKVKHLFLKYGDLPRVKIHETFDKGIKFIEDNLRDTNVLVHCMGGVSRSATLVIAYLMQSQKWSLEQTYDYVKCKRHQINPNDGFMEQLRQFEKQQQSD